jgi:hypothetical protein
VAFIATLNLNLLRSATQGEVEDFFIIATLQFCNNFLLSANQFEVADFFYMLSSP